MIEHTVDIPTKDGAAATFIVHPERDAPHPVVILLMDAPGIREELRDMARRLASVGYYVMLPNLYYRRGVMELGSLPPLPAERARTRVFELMASLSIPLVMEDGEALLAFAGRDPAAHPGRAGVLGYGLSGQYAINLAAQFPQRIAAAACIDGVQLVTDQDDSPHLAAQRAKAEIYFACAEGYAWAPIEMIEALAQALKAHRVAAEVELYSGVRHGFAFPNRRAYDKAAAERHWERLFSLFRRRLQAA